MQSLAAEDHVSHRVAEAFDPLRLVFVVEPRVIREMSLILEEPRRESDTRNAVTHARKIALDWGANESVAAEVLGKMDLLEDFQQVTVCVLPDHFRVGACDTATNRILLGQPIRHQGFATALLVHELVHIGIAISCSSTGTAPPDGTAEEIVAFIAESEVHRSVGRSLQEVWSSDELDEFHEVAAKVTVRMQAVPSNILGNWRELAETAARSLGDDNCVQKPLGLASVLRSRREQERNQS